MRIFRKTILFLASATLIMLGIGCSEKKKEESKKKEDSKKIELQEKIDSLRESLEVVEEIYGPPEMMEEYNREQAAKEAETEAEIERLEKELQKLE